MKLPLVTLFLFITIIAFPQEADHWKAVIDANHGCKYFIPDAEIGDAWKGPGFDDSGWTDGINGIGYGDGDDATVVPSGIHSVYIRFTFNLDDITLLEQLILDMDYDDGFAAYLNGTEIASGNITKPYTWDMTLERDHEAKIYQGLLPDRYILGEALYAPLITNGENILAVEIHNVGTTSSDMSLLAFLHANFSTDLPQYSAPETWFNPPVTLHSHLPIVTINTYGNSIPDEPKIHAWMDIIFTEGDTSSQFDTPNVYSGHIGIERRGESSSGFPKKQYAIETRTAQDSNLNVPLLGMPEENDWILYAPYSDKSLIKNVLTYKLSREMGESAPRTRYVEVVLNGDYQGIYVLIEKIKQDSGRVNIAKLLPTDTEGDEVTGGYVIRNDKTTDLASYEYWLGPSYRPYGLQSLYQFYDPKYDDLVYKQRRYIVDFTKTFEDALIDGGYRDSINGYRKYTDVFSYIHMMFINEISMNVDCYHFSTYFYKDKDSDGGKFFSGPVWDYNIAWGNVNYGDVNADDGFIYTRGGRMFHWRRMMDDPWYANVAYGRWDDLRSNVLSWQNIEHIIDSCVTLMGPAIDRNYERWPVLGTYIWPNVVWPDTYEEEITMLKDFIIDRLPWLDSQWSGKGDYTDYPPHIECPGDQYFVSNAGRGTYIAGEGELDPIFVWDDFNIASLENSINGDRSLNGVMIPDGTEITWTVTDSKGRQNSCNFSAYVEPNSVITDVFAAYQVNMYPNPASELFMVEANFPITEILVQTMDGKTIQHTMADGERKVQVNTGSFTNGAYIVTVRSSNGYRHSALQVISR